MLRDPSGFWTFFFFGNNLDATLLFVSCVEVYPYYFFFLPSCGISCFHVLFWSRPCVRMSVLRWHRLSLLWKNWMFNQEPAEDHSQISKALGHEAEPRNKERNTLKDDSSDLRELGNENLDYTNQKSENKNKNLEFINLKSIHKIQRSELLKRSISEPCSQVSLNEGQPTSCPHRPESCGCESRRSCYSEEGVDSVLQVDNGSEGDDSFLQREGSQRRSRRRFRRVNPKGERELITDGQEPTGYNTVVATHYYQ